MITGLFLRHYKTYQGLYFIPMCNDYTNKYSVFIGNNGVGKSSILEALNTFFNNTYWNISKNSKKAQAFIAPVFLINKQIFMERIYENEKLLDYVEFLSDYFWNVTSEANSNMSSEEFARFFEYRNYLKEQYREEEFYFFILGIEYENKSKVNFITFNADLTSKLPEELKNFVCELLLEKIRDYFSYVYISVSMAPSDILRIEGKETQELMNSDILNKIDSVLNEKKFDEGRRNISVIDYLNNSLNQYMDSINEIIKIIDKDYEFKVEGNGYKNTRSIFFNKNVKKR
jgi:predicted ATP-dependent endonuclease of OLD family